MQWSSNVFLNYFLPHIQSICMHCINWPSMKWRTLHASNYHMGWIFVQKCVPLCTRVCVHAHLRFMHVLPVCLREDEYILLEPVARHCDQSTQGGHDNASTCATWLHELKERHCVACHWNYNLRVLHILEVLVRYTCIARIRFGNQIMNKYHTIACKVWVIYAWCRHSFNSYSSSHSKSINFYKKARASWICRISKTWE